MNTKYQFPAVRVYTKGLYFNALCEELGESRSIDTHKSGDMLFSRGRQDLGGLRIHHGTRDKRSFYICSKSILEVARLKQGSVYELRKCKAGWWLKISEPLEG